MDIVSATVPSRSRYSTALKRAKENMMLRNLYDHAVETQTLKSKKAKYVELHENGNEVTLLYKIEGQRYPNDKPSARTMPKHIAKTEIRVDEEGYIIGGTVIKKQNFWTWDYKSEDGDEA